MAEVIHEKGLVALFGGNQNNPFLQRRVNGAQTQAQAYPAIQIYGPRYSDYAAWAVSIEVRIQWSDAFHERLDTVPDAWGRDELGLLQGLRHVFPRRVRCQVSWRLIQLRLRLTFLYPKESR
jgi:hypothetical protein